jgi:hypothetical protein
MPRQFRLRSLFILTAIVAVGCWVYSDPLTFWLASIFCVAAIQLVAISVALAFSIVRLRRKRRLPKN